MDRCDSWSINADTLKRFVFGEIRRHVTTEEFQLALKSYLVGRLGQMLRGEVLDTSSIDRQIRTQERRKERLLETVADGLIGRDDPVLRKKLTEIGDRLAVLHARKRDIEHIVGINPDPDAIAEQLLERVRNLTELMDSASVEDQRRVLFSFCKRLTADADARELVIETDLTGLAQKETLPGVPAGLCNCSLPEWGVQQILQPVICILSPRMRFRAA